jgi:tetratricopeptide (TPR) repeat protein
MKNLLSLFSFCILASFAFAQNADWNQLPKGRYAVGFKTFVIVDENRIVRPEYNYLGEKDKTDRRRKFQIHLWYPAEVKNEPKMTLEAYNLAHITENFDEKPDNKVKTRENQRLRDFYQNNLKAQYTESDWQKMLAMPLLAHKKAGFAEGKFPLLVGSLRPYSTTLTNEMLASQGYIVAMVHLLYEPPYNQLEYMRSYPDQIFDFQIAMNHIIKTGKVAADQIGTFGFSGSGFAQVLWAMNDSRVRALADLESGIYMDGLWQSFSSSNLYDIHKLKIPFLHLFGRDLSAQEKFIEQFEKKKHAERYYVKLNQAHLHHWDFATEGYTSAAILKGRGELNENIKQSFELANLYLLQFFNAYLKNEANAQNYLTQKNKPQGYSPDLYTITNYPAIKPAPTSEDFLLVSEKKGFSEAFNLLNKTISIDPEAAILQGGSLNNLGYYFLGTKKIEEAIQIFKLNVQLHDQDPNFYDSLGEAYQISGKHPQEMKKVSEKILELLPNDKINNDELKKGLKKQAEERIKLVNELK